VFFFVKTITLTET